MAITLKDNTYLTLAETRDWLKIKLDDDRFDEILKRFINTACARVESYIDSPVLSREYVEFIDGNDSNVLIPTYWPITSVTELKIDYGRLFESANPLTEDNFVLRGFPALSQPFVDPEFALDGTDIVLRDESSVTILGRIFSGSTVQSIRVTYKAGRGETADDVPDDLRTATLMLVEYLYTVKENRELGVGSKGVMGQSYTRKQLGESGMPEEIEAMLQPYKDFALPPNSVMQKNKA